MRMLKGIILYCLTSLMGLNVAWATAETLNLGTLNEGLRGQIRIFQPLLTYLEDELEDIGISEVRLVVHPSTELMAAAMARKEVDIFIDSPLVVAKIAKASGGIPFLRHWKDGHAFYYSVIFTRVDSDIHTLQDLQGRRVAMEDHDSSSGFIAPAHMLLQVGLTFKKLRAPTASHTGDEVGYFLTYNDKNTLFSVASGRADAGATSHDNFLDLMEARPDEFRIIATSDSMPRSVLLHRPGLSKPLLDALRETLKGMSQSEEGREILAGFHNSAGFDEFAAGPKRTFTPIFEVLQDLEDAGVK